MVVIERRIAMRCVDDGAWKASTALAESSPNTMTRMIGADANDALLRCLAGFDPFGVEFLDLAGLDFFNRILPKQGYAQQAEADPSKQGSESGSFPHGIKLFQNHSTQVFTERA